MAQARSTLATRLRYFVGGRVEIGVVNQARETFAGSGAHEHYRISLGTSFIFEALDDEDNFAKIVVDSWLNVSPDHCVIMRLLTTHRTRKTST